MRNLLTRWLSSALALMLVMQLDPGIKIRATGAEYAVTLCLIILALSFANAFLRPIILFFAWPINCLTFGLLGFTLNFALFWLVGRVVPDFYISSPKDALIGFLVMGLAGGLLNYLLTDKKK